MNTPRTNDTATQATIDHALHRLGSAQPDPGMNNRILRRLNRAAVEPAHRLSPWPRLAFASLAGCGLCVAVVFGSLQHSHAVAAQDHPVLPILQQQGGISTASSTRIAVHPALAPKGGGRSDQHLGEGRATIKPGTHVHGGDGIPVPPQVR
ncbi:MAG: hypothetical protein ACLGPM_09765 [Acidobacteriota bacterium]